jgi:glycosyltransferase involved in cell wall biosynthesis
MIKIFEIISTIGLGGAENLTFNVVEQCSLRFAGKFQFVIIELYASKSFYSRRKKVDLRAKGVKIITLGGHDKRSSLIIAPFNLLRYIKKEKPQIIHSHTDLPDFVLGLVLKLNSLKNIKIVRTIHNVELWSEYHYIGKLVESSFIEDAVIGVSKGAIDSYCKIRNKYKLPVSSKRKTIYNGCSIPNREIHHFKLDSKRINIAFCGRFVYQKGIDILVRFIETLDSKIKDKILFHFIGDGMYKDLVLKLVERNENVVIYSPVSSLASKIYGFDYLIMPSRFEGLGLISIESSLSGVPVIAAKVPGLDETLPENWPLFFNLDNSLEIENILQSIVNAEFNRERLKTIAYEYVSNKFSMEEMIKGYADIYLN